MVILRQERMQALQTLQCHPHFTAETKNTETKNWVQQTVSPQNLLLSPGRSMQSVSLMFVLHMQHLKQSAWMYCLNVLFANR